MNSNLSAKNIDELKGKLKKKYPQLTEADLQHKEGREESFLRMIAYKLRKTKIEVQNMIASL